MELLPESYVDCIGSICTQIIQFEIAQTNIVCDFLFDTEMDKVILHKVTYDTSTTTCWSFNDENITVREALSLMGYTCSTINITYPENVVVENFMDTPIKRCELTQFTLLPLGQ
jgi:hypothetical protein